MLLLQFIPPFTAEPVSPEQAGWVVGAVLSEAIVYDLIMLFPLFKILAILMILSLVALRNKASKAFSIYAGISYTLFAFLQSIAFTEEFGFAVLTLNLVMFLLVAMIWFWEAKAQRNDFTTPHLSLSRVWVIPFAFLAFWYPIDLDTMAMDFNPLLLVTSMAGLAFCLMTPIFLSILIIFFPSINVATLRVTSTIGIVISFYNILVNFFMFPELLFWNGVLHIPLIVLSVYGFILSFRHKTTSTSPAAKRKLQFPDEEITPSVTAQLWLI